jgi:2-polyprenyl-3-methyl-5-hydroxy-6-metoxy-1,4-benzoquinol methylase
MRLLRRFADSTKPDSLAAKLRRRRFELFLGFLQQIPIDSLTILDIGGTETFWESMGYASSGHSILLLNLQKCETHHKQIISVVGDACSMPEFRDQQFDVVFSNSVIEHLGTYENQQSMANEVRRTGKRYFVQTPNYFFPIEPHFLSPFFHWLPIGLRIFLVRHLSLGWYDRTRDAERASQLIREIRLLKKSELASLFPEATIWHERLLGLTKSFVVMKT